MSWDHATVFAWSFSQPGNFSVAPVEIRDSNIFLCSSIIFSFDLHSRWVHPNCTWSRNEVGFVKIHMFSSSSSTWEPYSASFQQFLCLILVCEEQKDIPNLVLFPIQVSIELPRIVCHSTILPMGVHVNFVQEVPQGLECLPMVWAICVVEDVSTRLDILTSEFWAISERLSVLSECKRKWRRLLVRHNLAILQ